MSFKYLYRIVLSALFIGCIAFAAKAQTQFISTGKIEYEIKVNMYKRIGENNDSWLEQVKGKLPQFSTTYSDLYFTPHSSAYKQGREVENPWKNFWGMGDGEDDVIVNNYDSGKTVTQKQVFEKQYRIDDSLVNIEWRITNDTRTIAGFECRKAVGRFYDSLYVVAFYTEEITTPAGPGNYCGLPGMILGLAFPRFYTTIFATKLELITPTPKDLAIPAKGKKASRKEMFAQVKDATKRWGDDWQKYYWQAVL